MESKGFYMIIVFIEGKKLPNPTRSYVEKK